MMRLVTLTGHELVLPGEASFEVGNPSFTPGEIPGTISDPLQLAWCETNLVALRFPHLYRGPGGPPPIVVDCYLDGLLWRRGKLVFDNLDVSQRLLSYQFVADAADLATAIDGVKLPSIDLGTVPLNLVSSSGECALLPVRNATFYGDKDKAPASYKGYLNYPQQPGAVIAPQPYLVPVLRRVLAHFGYQLVGEWADDAEIQTAVMYSDRLCVDPGEVTLNQHVPDIDVADLLLGVAGQFCLQVYVNPQRRQVRFTPLASIVKRAAASQKARAGTLLTTVANKTTGFTLQLEPDSNDELDKTLDTSWQKLVVGAGGESQSIKAGTLHLVTVPEGNRVWQVPAYEGKGAVPGNADVGNESRVGLRLLFNRGLQPDSTGTVYPLGSPATTNQQGTVVGQYDLRWAGAKGLYQVWHKPWLDFRARAVQHTYRSGFTTGDLLLLDPSQADYVDYHLCFWEKITFSVAAGQQLHEAEFTYHELL